MTLVSDIITAALARNVKNTPGVIATSWELMNAFRRIYPVFWTIGARVNPSFFGVRELLDLKAESVPDGWARPADAEMIFRLETVTGARIALVDVEERDADPFTPALYEWGQAFYSAGNALDPVVAEDPDITVWYSKKPDEIALVTDELEALWPEHFNELLVLELAALLAHKDERGEELGLLRADRDVWLRRFIAHLEHATLGKTRSTGTSQRFTGPTWLPLNALLTGGSEVSL